MKPELWRIITIEKKENRGVNYYNAKYPCDFDNSPEYRHMNCDTIEELQERLKSIPYMELKYKNIGQEEISKLERMVK